MRKICIRALVALFCCMAGPASAENTGSTLFTDVNVFDGVNNKLHMGMNVLVEGNLIRSVSRGAVPAGDATVIDGAGRTLMPGMIDVHTHLAITSALSDMHGNITPEENAIRSTVIARDFLLDGFTTVRDLGGNTFGLKASIDSGLIPGPRIFPSGAFISQTSGHGDFRTPAEPHPSTGHVDAGHRLGLGVVADGKAEVYRAVRENLRKGATQIKMMGSGGAGSDFDPIDSLQFQPEEQMAAVAAAADWGTYVTAHLLNDRAIDRALDSGVMCVDHGLMIRQGSVKKLVAKGAFLAPQFNALSPRLQELPGLKPVNVAKIKAAQAQMESLVPLIKKYRPKVPFAVDAFGPPANHIRQRRYELHYVAELFGSFETLRRATSVSGELLAMSGRRNPYGKLGVIEAGALADILLIDGNPLEDIGLVGADEGWWDADTREIETISLIMKNGVIYKNTLQQTSTDVYLLGAVSITDPERLPEYQAVAGPLASKTGGYVPLAFAGPEMIEGVAPTEGLYFIERYDSREGLMAFVNSPEFQQVKKLRDQVADVHFMMWLPAMPADSLPH